MFFVVVVVVVVLYLLLFKNFTDLQQILEIKNNFLAVKAKY